MRITNTHVARERNFAGGAALFVIVLKTKTTVFPVDRSVRETANSQYGAAGAAPPGRAGHRLKGSPEKRTERNASKFHLLCSNVSKGDELFSVLRHCVFIAWLTIIDKWQCCSGRVDNYCNSKEP